MPTRSEVIARLTAGGAFELVEDHSPGYPLKIYRNGPKSMREVLQSTRVFDDRTFLIYGDQEITFREHFEQAAALAHFLRGAGVGKGDRVAIGMRNYPEWVISFWACQAIGAVVVALNAWWTGAELTYALEDSAPMAMLIDGERLARLSTLIGGMNLKALVVARRNGAGPGRTDFAEAVAKRTAELPAADIGPSDYCTILYTSGTTGRPKGAVATQQNHITNYMNTLLSGAVARGLMGDFSEIAPADMPQGGSLQTFPFFHIGGLTGLYLSTGTGSKLAVMYKWNPAEAVQLVAKHKLSGVSGVPIVVRQLLESARASGADVSSVLGVSSGGAAVPPDLIRQIGKQFEQKAAPANGYGLTETTSAVITNSGADYFAHPDSIGRPVATAEVRFVDDSGKDLGNNQIGELWIRGANVIPGYWNKPDATEAAFGGGWFRTGDLGYQDDEGFCYVVDRKKDVIIRGGENVYCAEVEAAILEHPLVRDVAVVGLPDPEYGEQVAAVIQVGDRAQARALPDELRASLATTLARFKIPSAYQVTEEELPRTATGKVLKRELRSMFKAEPAASAAK
ncbi:MAG: acyl--CoA ligase [Alphaproteobacteria bacterium]|nr:acyl--CoA ligase [Alphaproteobacteria bacterium]